MKKLWEGEKESQIPPPIRENNNEGNIYLNTFYWIISHNKHESNIQEAKANLLKTSKF